MTKIQVNSQGKAYTANGKALKASEGGSSLVSFYEVNNGVATRTEQVFTGHEFDDITSIEDYAFIGAFCTYYYKSSSSSIKISNGPSGPVRFPSLKDVGYYGLYRAFYDCTGITSVDLSSLTTVEDYGLSESFYGCTGITSVDLSSLTTVEDYGLSQAFCGCTGITSVDLSSLEMVDDNGLWRSFEGSKVTRCDLSSLTTIKGRWGLTRSFAGCTLLTYVDLSSLTTAENQALYYTFNGCINLTDIYFNSLTTQSFGSYTNQFAGMMNATGTNVTHTLHFPSNLETTIQGLTGYPTFGGTSGYVVLAFDLPATS